MKRKCSGKKQVELKKMKPKSVFKNRLKNLSVKDPEEIEKWKEEQSAKKAPVQLQLFFEEYENNDQAALPNTIARSALFASIRPGRRKFHQKAVIASRKDAELKYTGEQLDMGDSDVFLQAIRVIEKYDLGTNIQILPYAFLREMGRKTGKTDKQWLDKSFERLTTGTLIVHVPGQYKAVLHLVDEYIHDEKTDTYYIRMNPKIISLFQKERYGLIDWAKRKQIKTPLAKWLQTFVGADKKDQEHKVSLKKLKEWCGQSNRPIRKFRQAFNKALSELLSEKIVQQGYVKNDIFYFISG